MAAREFGLSLARIDHRAILSETPGILASGGNSGYQAVNLAYMFGARRIILLGFDMQHTGGRRHFHADYPAGMGNAEPVAAWRDRFGRLATALHVRGVEVVNATRQTALTCFPRSDLDEVLA